MSSIRTLVFKAWIPMLIIVLFVTAVSTVSATGETGPKLNVTVKAEAVYDSSYNWTIEKTVSPTSLTLSPGQVHAVDYNVVVSAIQTNSAAKVTGMIWITNPTPNPVLITHIENTVDGANVPVVCMEALGWPANVSFPFEIKGNWTMICYYNQVELASVTPGINTFTAYTDPSSGVANGSRSTTIVAGAGGTVTDACIDVTDDKFGSLGTVCAGDAPKTFNYSMTVGPYDTCGDYEVINTASFTTSDTGSTGSDSAVVDINVPCAGGCTLTPGYWKTHSSYGPARYDDTWAMFGGADASFYLSGQSYYQVLWTAPKGNAYYILAHAYIAAQLNELNGASGVPTEALTFASNFFSTFGPDAELTKTQRGEVIKYAGMLDAYNNGLTGPGHCTE